ncbi:hypothetical protein IWW36_004823, partial [Coemansia brasiliensis]
GSMEKTIADYTSIENSVVKRAIEEFKQASEAHDAAVKEYEAAVKEYEAAVAERIAEHKRAADAQRDMLEAICDRIERFFAFTVLHLDK